MWRPRQGTRSEVIKRGHRPLVCGGRWDFWRERERESGSGTAGDGRFGRDRIDTLRKCGRGWIADRGDVRGVEQCVEQRRCVVRYHLARRLLSERDRHSAA